MDWARIIGFLGVSLSLIFVGLELRESQRSTQLQYSGDSSNRSLEYRTVLAENADVWLRGCKAEDLTDAEDFVFNSLVVAFMIEVEHSWRRSLLQLDSDSQVFFENLAALNIHRYPGIRRKYESLFKWEHLKAKRSLWHPQLTEGVRTRLSELEAEGSAQYGDPNFCGLVW